MIQDQKNNNFVQQSNSFQNKEVEVFVTIQRSNSGQVMIGNINIIPKISLRIPPIMVSIKGMYIVSQNEEEVNEADSSHQKYVMEETVQDIIQTDTKRQDQMKASLNKKKQIDSLNIEKSENSVCEVFLEGKQIVGESKKIQIRKKGRKVNYPFNFTVPSNLPSSIDSIFFANKNIEIRYLISVQTLIKNKEEISECHFKFNFPIHIPETTKNIQQTQLVNELSYFCFTKYCCQCLGTYHIEFNATVLHSGNLQVECRIYRQDNKTINLFKKIEGVLYGELKKERKVVLGKKQFPLNRNQFGMLEGQVLFEYEPSLKSYKTNLFSINFWLEPQIQFQDSIWKINRKNHISHIIL